MKFAQEFKEFAMRGNVVDLAVAVIIGAAFGKIVSSLVNDIVMPIVGKLLGNVDFAQLFINLSSVDYPSLAAAEEAGAPVVRYGLFINTCLDFVVIALAIFVTIKALSKLKRAEEAAPEEPETPPEPSEEVVLLREIRDSLKRDSQA